jgi:hypothetical protein
MWYNCCRFSYEFNYNLNYNEYKKILAHYFVNLNEDTKCDSVYYLSFSITNE